MTKNAVNYDGDTSKTITLREDTTIRNVADTTIEDGAKNAVNAGTVYNETRVKRDGTYVKVSNTAGENLSALDNQVTSNTQNINYLNVRVGELGDRINKVGAGAAALAALHRREIAELKARDVQNAKDKAEMKADNAEMKAEIEALKKQVEALAAKK